MEIKKIEAYYPSSNKENNIHCLLWLPETSEPRAIVQLAHGVAEHIERYDGFARFLAGEGFIVCGNDHLGHGKSVRNSEDVGFFAQDDGDIRLVDDMHILSLIMKKRYPSLPLFLFGHSMGSFCARVYASVFPDELSGLILCATGEIPASAVVLEKPLSYLCQKLGGRTSISNSLFDKITCLGIKDKQTDKDWLSRNRENVYAFLNDPLCGGELKLGGVRDLISLAASACSTQWAKSLSKTLPILIISGAKDPISLNGKGIIALSDNLEDEGIFPTVIMYPGDRHEILNEENHENVYLDVFTWLNDILNNSTKESKNEN